MSLIDFRLLDTQVQEKYRRQHQTDKKKDLVNSIDNLMLDQDETTPIDTLVPPPDTSEEKHEAEGTKDDDERLTYNITEQEWRLQCKEERYGIYMSTFGYEGDDSDLDSDMYTDLNAMAHSFLEWKNIRKSNISSPLKEK